MIIHKNKDMSSASKNIQNDQTKSPTNNLKILSWNIQSSGKRDDSKFDDNDFLNLFKDKDIICLQEVRKENKVPGFRTRSGLREGENSGGVSIMFKNEIASGVKKVNKYCMADLLVFKLDKTFFKFESDIFIVNAYIPPFNTSRKSNLDGYEMLTKVSETVNELREKGEVILCGDFNARISNHPAQIKNDELNEHIPLPNDYIPDQFTPRQSKDSKNNPYCSDFLSLIMNNNLTILNGRTLGDLSGEFTSICPKGCSVIDYFALTQPLIANVNFLEILEFTIFSDHRPLLLTLKNDHLTFSNRKPLDELYDTAPCRFIYDDAGKEKFIHAQENNEFNIKRDELKSRIDEIKLNPLPCKRRAVKNINSQYVNYLRELAHSCFKTTKVTTKDNNNRSNKPWFNNKCKVAKRELGKAARATSNHPDSDFLRINYYHVKKFYNTLINKHKNKFFNKITNDVENGKILNWQQFKRLKNIKECPQKFDSLDMNNFETFFTSLYSDTHSSVDSKTKEMFLNKADSINDSTTNNQSTYEILNKSITKEEVKSTISSLKSAKASSDDMVANEILKLLNDSNSDLLTDLLNICLDTGIYPWNTNIITPLHKKGSKDNPDNYRAISVSSAIGKLFSTILLERFVSFRQKTCPDPPNQLGFTKKSQTYDHILTLQTISSKYKKLTQPVYAIFVDFRKAFDSVCRQALFLKLAQNKVTGKFYNVLRDMYSNSIGKIKLSGYISSQFKIEKGTEQGHPLSPDLFKLFLNDLSPLLDHKNCPKLSNILISHLLWADDLIMLSLDLKTAQSQLNQLNNFCNKWGLEVNISKTKSMVLGLEQKGSPNPKFKLGNIDIETVDNYCYLGIIINKSGSLKLAMDTLHTKAMRSLFGIKRYVNKTKISFRALTTLYDSLIKPVALYGAPVWLPTTPIIKNIAVASSCNPSQLHGIINKIHRESYEKCHISFLKWALGVHKKSSNIGCWGETGRYPLLYQSIKMTLKYLQRLNMLKPSSFVHAALQEQKQLDLPWYRNIEHILKVDKIFHQDHVTAYLHAHHLPPTTSPATSYISSPIKYKVLKPLASKKFRVEYVMKCLKSHFIDCWNYEKSMSPKFSLYYDKIKPNFCKENYLDSVKNAAFRYRTTRLRISAHDLEIETGRYKAIPRNERHCNWCKISLGEDQVEDEEHMLFRCDLYADLRSKLISTLHKIPLKLCNEKKEPYQEIEVIRYAFQAINQSSLPSIFKGLQSNFTYFKEQPNYDPLFFHFHQIIRDSTNIYKCEENELELQNLQSYIQSTLSTFIGRCFDKRWAFKKDTLKNPLSKTLICDGPPI